MLKEFRSAPYRHHSLRTPWLALVPLLACAHYLPHTPAAAETFRVATYNLEGYVSSPAPSWRAKTPESKQHILRSIQALNPDVLALQEIGGPTALLELQNSLKAEGLDLPNWDLVSGSDTNIQVAILSRFAITARNPHTNLSFLLGSRRHHVSRGFSDVEVQVNTNYSFTLITAHLKSRRTVSQIDEAELRLEEARLLRRIVDARLNENPKANLIVLGDLNDTRDSPPIKIITGRGRMGLVDTRPSEYTVEEVASSPPVHKPRNVVWTHYYSKEDTYSRIDYILLSPGMAKEWAPSGTFVLASPDWRLASDHRPLVAEFQAEER